MVLLLAVCIQLYDSLYGKVFGRLLKQHTITMEAPPDHIVLENPYGGKGPTIMAATWAQASVALLLMLLRTYTNACIVRAFKWDYFWAMLTFVCDADRVSVEG